MRIEDFLDRAMAAFHGGRREEARDLLVDVVALEPDNLEAWLRLAELAASPERAALYYQRASSIDSRSLRAQKGLEEARARLQPVKGREKATHGPAAYRDERADLIKPSPPVPGALPPDAPIFEDTETAPFRLELGGTFGAGKAYPAQRGPAA